MKKYIISVLLVIWYAVPAFWAELDPISKNPQTEEEICFDVLTQNVQQQYWVNLANVEKDERTGKRVNLSSYDSFQDDSVVNPNQKYYRWYGNFFAAKRNNIGTIRANGDYILSQFTGFWDDTAFQFPLKSNSFWYDNGDIYPDFRQNIVYTHHLLDGDFVSCGYLKIKPLGTHNLQSLGQNNYKTNVFEGSGFEMLQNSLQQDGKEFLVGKVSITAQDYADEPFFNIELITVAYNNKSSYFNEFETFPLQVEAMKNTSAQSGGLGETMIDFLEKVKNETCLQLPRNFWESLPSKCNGTYKSLSSLPTTNWLSFLLPSAHAKIESNEDYSQQMQEARGMVIYDGLSYELFEKLQQVPDENFKNWVKIALTPNYERLLEVKIEANQILTPQEEVFQACGIDYDTRVEIISDFLKNLDLEKEFNVNELTYSNPRFGDCIIPYPDTENKDQVIEWSFPSNQLYAQQLTATGSVIDELSSELTQLILDQNQAEISYNSQMAEFQKRLDAGDISPELESQIETLYQEFETTYAQQSQEIEALRAQGAQVSKDIFNAPSSSSWYLAYIIFTLLVLLGWALVYMWVRKKTENK